MVKAKATGKDGRAIIVLGISQGNVDRLKAGEPIYFDPAPLRIAPGTPIGAITLFYGKTDADLAQTLGTYRTRDDRGQCSARGRSAAMRRATGYRLLNRSTDSGGQKAGSMLDELYQQLITKARERSSDLPVGSIARDADNDLSPLRGSHRSQRQRPGDGDDRSDRGHRRHVARRARTLNGVTRWLPLERLLNFRTTPFLEGISGPSASRSRGKNSATPAKS